MTAQLERMIAAQPEAIRSSADPALTAPAAERLAGARRIWLIGTGTSLHAAELGAAELTAAGHDARRIAANAFTRDLIRAGDAAIVITHTGRTAYARRSRSFALEASLPLVSVTGPDVAWPEAVRTPIAETSETYTVSYTTALTVLAQIAHHLGAPGGPKAVETVAAQLDDEPGEVPAPARAMAIVGPGRWSVTAREGALKIRAGARILCEGFDPDRLLHGGAVPYTAADTLLVQQPTADADELTTALRHAAALERLPVATFSTAADSGSPLLDQIPMTVLLQRLALRFARHRAQNADLAITGAWADPELWPSRLLIGCSFGSGTVVVSRQPNEKRTPMDLQLTGKTAFVSGSTRGIGYAVAASLAAEGVAVTLNGRDPRKVTAAVEALHRDVPEATVSGLAADFGSDRDVEDLCERLGDVDILINNVGLFEVKPFTELTDDDWRRFFEVNVLSGVRLSRRLLPAMLRRGWGRVVFVSSESGLDVPADMVHYGATKSAMLALGNGLAKLTAGTAVTVNSVLGGPTYSDGVADAIEGLAAAQSIDVEQMKGAVIAARRTSLLRRFIEPAEIARTVTYLASPLASATNGSAVRVDGGVLPTVV